MDFYQKYIFLEFSFGVKVQNVAYIYTPWLNYAEKKRNLIHIDQNMPVYLCIIKY